ncbi:MAG: hypothetical protein Q8P22_01145, partial [Chloroflexota bacterium]|nr:hypothetical protein [Chloroflexota bacterium]
MPALNAVKVMAADRPGVHPEPVEGESSTDQRQRPEPAGTPPVADQTRARRALEHVHHLSVTIGPRGSTTPAEAEAATYAKVVLERLGLAPHVERFLSATSEWRPFALAFTLALLAVAVYPLAGRITAILTTLLAAATLVSAYLELNFTANPIRWLLPKRPSQNVWAAIPPRGTPTQRVVLVGHLDSHRTPWVFGSPARLKIFRVLITASFASIAALAPLYLAGSITGSDVIYWVSLAPAAVLILALL